VNEVTVVTVLYYTAPRVMAFLWSSAVADVTVDPRPCGKSCGDQTRKTSRSLINAQLKRRYWDVESYRLPVCRFMDWRKLHAINLSNRVIT